MCVCFLSAWSGHPTEGKCARHFSLSGVSVGNFFRYLRITEVESRISDLCNMAFTNDIIAVITMGTTVLKVGTCSDNRRVKNGSERWSCTSRRAPEPLPWQ